MQDTPMMQQYKQIKDAHPGFLLFYRMGDFYELFGDDAITASAILDITLTQRRTSKEVDGIPMCGVPFHAAEGYIARLLEAGKKVALCEQTEDPAEAKKRGGGKALVRREVVRLFTSGTLTEDSMLPAERNNFLAALAAHDGTLALGSLDLSTGEFATSHTTPERLEADLARLSPRELLVDDAFAEAYATMLTPWKDTLSTPQPRLWELKHASQQLTQSLGLKTLDGIGLQSNAQTIACGVLAGYVAQTQVTAHTRLSPPRVMPAESFVYLDSATRTNLELTQTLRGNRKGSLLDAVDRTLTSGGKRLLTQWLNAPLRDLEAIKKRQETISILIENPTQREALRDHLKTTADISRALARLTLGRGGPRDLGALKASLGQLPGLNELLAGLTPQAPTMLPTLATALGGFDPLSAELDAALNDDDLPMLARDGGFIRPGHDLELDRLRDLTKNGTQLLQQLEQAEAQSSSIPSLKVRYNKVWGYYIEITKTHAGKAPAHYIHRQTTTNSQRFTTPELVAIERDLTHADGEALAREQALYDHLVATVTTQSQKLLEAAHALATLDVLAAGAVAATQGRWCRPLLDTSRAFTIKAGRHPVVERTVDTFIPNDSELTGGKLWLITGPNMAGKSTYLRQNALIALLAHAGYYVPAQSAHIGLVDRIFTRIGAADDLARGQSTFMVEMVETANILNNASDKSLVILDEIGRGTATFDGLAIAWSCVEYLTQVSKARALFATHYHELTGLADKTPSIENAHVSVQEWQNDIVFMHEVKPGPSPRSYGIHVGRLAGLPEAVTQRAETILHQLETQGDGKTGPVQQMSLFQPAPVPPARPQPHVDPVSKAVLAQLKTLNPDDMTPREAHQALYELSGLLAKSTAKATA